MYRYLLFIVILLLAALAAAYKSSVGKQVNKDIKGIKKSKVGENDNEKN
jgi:hypothetical protein